MLALLKKKISMTPLCWLLENIHTIRNEEDVSFYLFEIKRMENFDKIIIHKDYDSDLFRTHKKIQQNRIRWGDHEDMTRRISKEDNNNTVYLLMAGLKDFDCYHLSMLDY